MENAHLSLDDLWTAGGAWAVISEGLFFLMKMEFLNSEINNSALVNLYSTSEKERGYSTVDAREHFTVDVGVYIE